MPEPKREMWTRDVERGLTHADTATFFEGIKDQSKYVTGDDEHQTIHSTYFGVKPDVLVDNTSYPIALQELEGEDFTVSLRKYQTKRTPITDDELYAITYDKIAAVKDAHVEAIAEEKYDRGIHAMAPTSDTEDTPVLTTSGADDGSGRKMLTRKDLVLLKTKCDKAKFPQKGRRLVLCSDHISDLLLFDQKFADQYYDYKTGKIANVLGFEIFEYVNNPVFNPATKTKVTYGAAADVGEYQASVLFCVSRAVKATGMTKMYFSKAENNPATQQNEINFRHYAIHLPTAKKCIGAIVSAPAA